jgi:hypothetical protein
VKILSIFFILFLLVGYAPAFTDKAYSKEIVLYGFEKDPQGWEIPDWVLEKKDCVARQISVSEFHSSEGKYSLEVNSDFASNSLWQVAYVERVIDITDWTPFSYVSLDIFVPREAPQGLRARIILTVGNEWKWVEMNKPVLLMPGEWTVIKADITSESRNWRKFIDNDFRSDIKKLGIRIESNGKISYKGPIYIDNVRLLDEK